MLMRSHLIKKFFILKWVIYIFDNGSGNDLDGFQIFLSTAAEAVKKTIFEA